MKRKIDWKVILSYTTVFTIIGSIWFTAIFYPEHLEELLFAIVYSTTVVTLVVFLLIVMVLPILAYLVNKEKSE